MITDDDEPAGIKRVLEDYEEASLLSHSVNITASIISFCENEYIFAGMVSRRWNSIWREVKRETKTSCLVSNSIPALAELVRTTGYLMLRDHGASVWKTYRRLKNVESTTLDDYTLDWFFNARDTPKEVYERLLGLTLYGEVATVLVLAALRCEELSTTCKKDCLEKYSSHLKTSVKQVRCVVSTYGSSAGLFCTYIERFGIEGLDIDKVIHSGDAELVKYLLNWGVKLKISSFHAAVRAVMRWVMRRCKVAFPTHNLCTTECLRLALGHAGGEDVSFKTFKMVADEYSNVCAYQTDVDKKSIIRCTDKFLDCEEYFVRCGIAVT